MYRNLLFVFILFFIFSACNDREENPVSETCKVNKDCKAGETCNTDTGECEIPWVCTTSESCYEKFPSEWNAETSPAVCQQGVCVAKGCTTNDECEAGKICSGGSCVEPADCSQIASVKITSSSPVLTQGSSKQLNAVALNRNGVAVAVADNSITWSSSNDSVVSVTNTGNATGGTESGTANLVAKHDVCQKESQALVVQNFAQLESGKLRVIVRNIDGQAVSGAEVVVNSTRETTDSNGYIEIDNSESTNTVSVFHAGYEYVTIAGTSQKDLVFYLSKALDQTKAGGFKGQFDFSQLQGGTVKLGLAGASLPGNIMDLAFDVLLGETIQTHVKIATIDDNYPIPSALVAIVGDNVVSDKYRATGLEGQRAFWGWGGKLDFSAMVIILTDALGGGMENLDIGGILTQIIPYVDDFGHALELNQTVSTCNKITDVNDINGNGSTSDLIPDFENSSCFPEKNLSLSQPLSKKSTVKLPKLPMMEGNYADLAVLLNASIVEGQGMIPMGISAGASEKDANELVTGIVPDVHLASAPQYNGLEGTDSIVVAFTLPVAGAAFGESESLPVKMSGIVKYYEKGNIGETVDMSSQTFLNVADQASLNGTTVQSPAISGANGYRIQITSSSINRDWIIYSSTPNISIPTETPASFGTDYSTILYQAISLKNGTSPLTLEDIFGFNSTNMDNLIKYIIAFSAFEIQ
ncbi:hypothetical protein JXR93_10585 [bacterium]|nr:hypothetical protein [bacterium]